MNVLVGDLPLVAAQRRRGRPHRPALATRAARESESFDSQKPGLAAFEHRPTNRARGCRPPASWRKSGAVNARACSATSRTSRFAADIVDSVAQQHDRLTLRPVGLKQAGDAGGQIGELSVGLQLGKLRRLDRRRDEWRRFAVARRSGRRDVPQSPRAIRPRLVESAAALDRAGSPTLASAVPASGLS